MSLQLAELTSRCNMSEMKRPNVRRCLFGRPDPDKQTEYFQKQERIFLFEEDARRFRNDWSFDPVTGPIEGGKFEYEIIPVKSSVPNFYTKSYVSRKPRPVVRLARAFCSFNDSNRPAKRKLDLDSQENDENEVLDKRVPSKGDMVSVPEMHHVSASSLADFKAGSLFDSPAGFISYSATTSSLPVLSPTSRNRDISTPPSRPRSLVQSSMKDFLSSKKQRLLNTKTLPRT